MKEILVRATWAYTDIWEDIHPLGWLWLVMMTIIPVVPALCVGFAIADIRNERFITEFFGLDTTGTIT